jgi:cellulose synthase operon protein C
MVEWVGERPWNTGQQPARACWGVMRDLTRFVASRSGRLPTVGEVPPYGIVGVSPSKYLERDPDPPYVRRDIDKRLDDALVQQRFLVLVGHSKTGKSRSAFEAMRRLFPTSTLVVPFSSTRSLAQLIRDPPFDVDSPFPVLWLDELDRYLGDPNGVDRALVHECMRSDRRMVLVGTISQRWRDRLADTPGAIGSAARAVLEHATQVELPSQLSARELAEAERRYPDDAFGRGGRSIGEQAVLAHELERRYELGPAAAPVGWALVRAAIDWRRTGMTRPIQPIDLRELALRYLDRPQVDRISEASYERALAWARWRVTPRIALLQASTERPARFRAFDHIVEYADRQAGPGTGVPSATWDFVLERASPQEAARIGSVAYTGHAHESAHDAWSQASASRDEDVAWWAAEQLASLHGGRDREGDRVPGEEMLAVVRPERLPRSAVDQGLRLVHHGDLRSARVAFAQAIASGDPDEAPQAAVHLGLLFAEEGDVEGADEAFGWAATSGHWDYAPWGFLALGSLLARLGDVGYAQRAYRHVIDSGHPDAGAEAARRLKALPPG